MIGFAFSAQLPQQTSFITAPIFLSFCHRARAEPNTRWHNLPKPLFEIARKLTGTDTEHYGGLPPSFLGPNTSCQSPAHSAACDCHPVCKAAAHSASHQHRVPLVIATRFPRLQHNVPITNTECHLHLAPAPNPFEGAWGQHKGTHLSPMHLHC